MRGVDNYGDFVRLMGVNGLYKDPCFPQGLWVNERSQMGSFRTLVQCFT